MLQHHTLRNYVLTLHISTEVYGSSLYIINSCWYSTVATTVHTYVRMLRYGTVQLQLHFNMYTTTKLHRMIKKLKNSKGK